MEDLQKDYSPLIPCEKIKAKTPKKEGRGRGNWGFKNSFSNTINLSTRIKNIKR